MRVGHSRQAVLLLLTVVTFLLVSTGSGVLGSVARTYYIAIEEGEWDYGPLKEDGATGVSFKDNEYSKMFGVHTDKTIGSKYWKARYYRYTDDTFSTKWPSSPRWQHLGILGPVIYCEVGDTVQIVLKNRAKYSYSIHVHGLYYEKDSEGMMDQVGESMPKGVVSPGDSYVYHYQVPERSGPGPSDPSSIVWMYHSHVDAVADPNSGLIGAIVVARPGALAGPVEDPYVNGIIHEFVTLYNVFDETQSNYYEKNIKRAFKSKAKQIDTSDETFITSNLKFSINGYIYNNLPGLSAYSGEPVRWYVMAIGDNDVHTAHWHGQTLIHSGERVDVESILSAQTKTLDMIPDSKGNWVYHCHVDYHLRAGMSVVFTVL
eukprot:TRINITY_DN7492_c1_g1_i1.p1 TRINITY_DN7492_c1_g1~~TRINITY_DN7492_c1_g1_i1.p1  ORF type:complete len:374 (+),score=55.84 TRINITY_DN7492_c1_g1_i1:72-1193(+)